MAPKEQSFRRVGRFELIRKIATGGMAELFLARFTGPGGFEKRCAVKRILPEYAENEEFTRMFLNEARVAAMFDHPNLVQIFELGTDEETGQHYIAMELITGMDLRQLQRLCREQGRQFPVEISAYLAVQALDGLAYVHEFRDANGTSLNLVHRDVSPQNILVSYEGAVKLVDFGIVKASINEGHTRAGMLKGKIAYMSPEQAAGEPIDSRSDLFSVGAVLYELVTGQKPFRGTNELMTLQAIQESEPPPLSQLVPDCPEQIVHAVARALQKQPNGRYQTARDFQLELAQMLRACPLPLDRHLVAQFVKSLSEADTGRFDEQSIRIPRSTGAEDSGGSLAPAPLAEALTAAVESDTGISLQPGVDLAHIDEASLTRLRPSRLPIAIGLTALAAAAVVVAASMILDAQQPRVIAAQPTEAEPIARAPWVASTQVQKASSAAATSTPAVTSAPTGGSAAPISAAPVKGDAPVQARPPSAADGPAQRPAAAKSTPPVGHEGGTLSLSTVPRGVWVKLGSHALGRTPLDGINLPAGKHVLSLTLPRLGISRALSIEVDRGQMINRTVTFGRATLRVNARPWAEVFIDGESVGKTPLQRAVYEGRHEVRLVNPEQGERIQIVEVASGDERDLRVKF